MKQYLKPMVLVTTIVTIIINALANILPYNGLTTAEISDSFKIYFVPAGYVFAIWGVIYLVTTIYAIYQLRKNNEALLQAAPYIIIGNIVNSVWIFAWHYLLIPLTLPLMLVLLYTLIKTYLILFNAKNLPRIFTTLPYGIYLGWISVATVANTTDLLDYLGVKSLILDGQTWAAILIIVAGALGLFFITKFKEFSYALVIMWAVLGIASKFPTISIITTSAYLVTGILFIALAYKAVTSLKLKN